MVHFCMEQASNESYMDFHILTMKRRCTFYASFVFKEEEAHFLRLVSVLHDLLVCDVAAKDKRDELHR